MKQSLIPVLLALVAIGPGTQTWPAIEGAHEAAHSLSAKKVRAEVGAECECSDGTCRDRTCTVYVEASLGPVQARVEAEQQFRERMAKEGARIKGSVRITLFNL